MTIVRSDDQRSDVLIAAHSFSPLLSFGRKVVDTRVIGVGRLAEDPERKERTGDAEREGEREREKEMARSVFVTVGTTSFDDLIEEMDKKETLDALLELGCTRIVIQFGRGLQQPVHLPSLLHDVSPPVHLESFAFAPSIAPFLEDADLVISHGGSGSILEALREGKKLIVVINRKLMHDHQTQLAKKLSDEGYLVFTDPPNLLLVCPSSLSISESIQSIPFHDP